MDAMLYCEQFLEKVFYFSLRKTGSEANAEELAAEISCEVLAGLSRGAQPQSFRAWVWQIARNRWARWAHEHYGTPFSAMEDIDALALPGDVDVEQSAVAADEVRRVRRELAFIRSDYRTLLVAQYFEGKTMSTIARELHLPIGTVKTRLARGRRQLKEGMEMARDFGKRSFAPENVDFVNSCSSFGSNGQPWTILGHLMYKNIFLEVYNNPETAEALSLELGIAMPYMESELEYLTRETFLTKKENRYETAFPILSREVQERIHNRYQEIAPELTGLITAELDAYAAACGRIGEPVQGPYQLWEHAKWMLLIRAVDIHRWAVEPYDEPVTHTRRPDGGQWDIVGFQAADIALPQHVGQHGSYVNEQNNLPFVNFSNYRFSFRGIQNRSKARYEHRDIAALKLVCEGKAELCEAEQLDRLAEYGLIRRDGENWTPDIAVFAQEGENQRLARFTDAERADIHAKAKRIEDMLRAVHDFARQAVRDDLPEAFRADERLLSIINDLAVNDRGYVLEQAFRDGWLQDDGVCRTLGMWLNL